jgi:hypothetical protein
LKTADRGLAVEKWLAGQNFRPLPWLCVFAILMAAQISPWWYPTPDATTYLSMARSIALEHRLSNLGGTHLGYPPGYPLIISPAFLLSSRPFLFLSLIHWMLAVIFMVAIYRWFRKLAPGAAVLLTGLTMVNVAFWIYFRRTLTETAFMAVMMWAVVVLDSALEAGSAYSAAILTAAGTAAVIVLVSIRETGVLLVFGFAAATLLAIRAGRLRWGRGLVMAATIGGPAIAGVIAFMLYDLETARAAPSAVFGTHLGGFFDRHGPIVPRVIEGLRLRISEVGRLLVPGMFKAYSGHGQWLHPDILIYLIVFAVVILGWARLLRRRSEVLAATAPFYFVLYVVWAFDADTRYLLPLLPLLIACLWFAVESFHRWRLRFLAVLLMAHLAVALGYWIGVEVPRARACDAQWAAVTALAPGLTGGKRIAVATPDVPQCARLMLSFTIDRPVLESTAARDPGANQIVEPRNDPNPAGFRIERTAGPYKLLSRANPG